MTALERRILDAADAWYDSRGNAEAELAAAVAERRRERKQQDEEIIE